MKKRHLSAGELRAFYDEMLNATERDNVQQHLASCSRCMQKATAIRQRGEHIQTVLSELEPQSMAELSSPQLARKRFEIYRQQKKERKMTRNPFSRRYRPAWAAAALTILVALALTVPPVRTLAADFLSLFRVQKIEFTPVNQAALPDEETLETVAPEIEQMFDENLAISIEGEHDIIDEATARDRAQFPIRLPESEEHKEARYEWTPPVHISMQIDLPRLKALFKELGYQDIDLPKALDGKTVEADFEGMLTAAYGDCEEPPSPEQTCITLVQMPSPTASVPGDFDVDQLGRVYLELLGMTEEEAITLSERIDWATTLVVPFPHHVNLTYEPMSVDGVEGTLIHSESGYRPMAEYLLIWVKDDIIYAVAGRGEHDEALTLINSLK